MRRVEEAVGGWPVIDRNGYPYVVSPLMDGVPSVDPGMLSDVAEEMVRIGDFDCDIILAPEAMGIMYAAVISDRTGIPFSVVRKRRYGLDGEVPVSVDTGYSHSEQFINGVTAGMRVAVHHAGSVTPSSPVSVTAMGLPWVALTCCMMRSRRSIIGSPLIQTNGLGVCTPSCAKRLPSPAAIIANFMSEYLFF